jgi:hypothetical protein
VSASPACISLSPSDQLAYCTIRLECTGHDGSVHTGTGFFFKLLETAENYVPVIVTNRHVVRDAAVGKFLLHGKGPDGLPVRTANRWVELHNFKSMWRAHPNSAVDLAIVFVGPIFNQMVASGQLPFFIPLDKSLVPTHQELDELLTVEDVLMVGYPNGMWDSHNNFPIMRRGITATHPAKDYEGLTEFLIDAAVFPGSSGSPVLLYNMGSHSTKDGSLVVGTRIKLLGVLHSAWQWTAEGDIKVMDVPTVDRPIAMTRIPINLGGVIRSHRILEFEETLRQTQPTNAPPQQTKASTD